MTRIIGAYCVGFASRAIAIVAQLHATKGWRPDHEASRRSFPNIGGWKRGPRRKPPVETHPMQRLMSDRITPIPITEKMLRRHGWYRRQVMKQSHSLVAYEQAAQ